MPAAQIEEHDTGPNSSNAMQHYGQRFGKPSAEEAIGFTRQAFPWNTSGKVVQVADDAANVDAPTKLEDDSLSDEDTMASTNDTASAESDDEKGQLCWHCQLPLGEICYRRQTCGSGSKDLLHGECMAQIVSNNMREEHESNQEDNEQEKKKQHEQYGIGWKPVYIPRNKAAASTLAMKDVPEGLVCLVADEETRSIRLASTAEPVAAVNLHYLSTALEVRRKHGHEPVFTLDPVNPNDPNSMQQKVFVPDWLAGTNAGEVLFQADYHLKELSMGQYKQPVVGMKCCLDFEVDGDLQDWRAREWFMVRKAEVQISESNVLIPFVKMGVEAREQVIQGCSLEDKQITRPDHPMVKYAEAFTRNFDLIAERKSVIHHLRDLAKTSVLAKYLVEAGIALGESWFHLHEANDIACSLEVPQLWNERVSSEVEVQTCGIKTGKDVRSVFGGVQFGLDKFALSNRFASASPAGSLSTLGMPSVARAGLAAPSASLSSLSMPSVARGGLTAPSASISTLATPSIARTGFTARSLTKPSVPLTAPTLSTAGQAGSLTLLGGQLGAPSIQTGRLKVGLSRGLDRINLPEKSEPVFKTSTLAPAAAPDVAQPTAGVVKASQLSAAGAAPSGPLSLAALPTLSATPGIARLQGVDLRLDNFDLSSATPVAMEVHAGSWGAAAKSLDECVALGDAFWSGLDDGANVFSEEDRSLLKNLFNPELSDRRMEGDCFAPPDSRHAYVTKLRALLKDEEETRRKRKELFLSKAFAMHQSTDLFPSSWRANPHSAQSQRRQGELHPVDGLQGQSAAPLLKTLKQTSATVFDRTTEEGLRFRIYQMGSLEVRTIQDVEGEEEVGTVFSARTPKAGGNCKKLHVDDKVLKVTEYVERAWDTDADAFRYYVVLESGSGHKIVSERLSDGTVTWEEDPEDLDDRNSLGKILRTTSGNQGAAIQEVQALHSVTLEQTTKMTAAACRQFSQLFYSKVADVLR